MGKRLSIGKTNGETQLLGGARQSTAGIQFQIAAIKERLAISEVRHGQRDADLSTLLVKLEKALEEINAFEKQRV